MKQILSVQNPLIKSLVQLQEKSKARKTAGAFIIEGKREIELAIAGGYFINQILFLPQIISENEVQLLVINTVEIIEISTEVYSKLAYRDSTEGIIAVAKTKDTSLSQIQLPKNPLILVVEAIEKPGNLGAMLRTADAANVDLVLIVNALNHLLHNLQPKRLVLQNFGYNKLLHFVKWQQIFEFVALVKKRWLVRW